MVMSNSEQHLPGFSAILTCRPGLDEVYRKPMPMLEATVGKPSTSAGYIHFQVVVILEKNAVSAHQRLNNERQYAI
jgi:hypothetical protein